METIKLKPYFSLDVETTGLDPLQDDLLSVSAIFDNGDLSVEPGRLPSIHLKRLLGYEDRLSGNPVAFTMNNDLLLECTKQKPLDESSVLTDITAMLDGLMTFFKQHQPEGSPVLAGKNAQKLDIPILDEHFAKYTDHCRGYFSKYVSHRVIDAGSLYFADFGEMVNLSKINKLLGRETVTHDAYGDALDVVFAIRRKFFKTNNK